ncbi:MAG: DNA polymerase III subunit gamma/tau [Candidatus Omnitrophica bacterium]|nr:DNA polymerase III subunit gamma/tau [Candidatus Omnitrophota bacterium]
MSYVVLARKYRPQSFDDVIGQEDVVSQLQGALKSGRLGHAFLFCGPRGTGKTTCARILAKELNKIKTTSSETFALDSNMDVIEIDGASNRGIDEIRTLRENVQFVPMSGAYKIYIIDEVHMLTEPAFNALLKTLEEPPAHVKFIFATTDPSKLPLTVTSRCQRFAFKRISLEAIVKQLESICKQEKLKADDEALYAVAKASQGSMRDALSILDQLSSTSSGIVSVKDVNSMFGFVETELLFSLTSALIEKSSVKALATLENIVNLGKDIKQLTQDLVEFYRHLMIMKAGGTDLQGLIDYSKSYKEMLFAQSAQISMKDILRTIDVFIAAQDTARITESPRLALEIAFAKITSLGGNSPEPQPSLAIPQSASGPKPTFPNGINNKKGSVIIDPNSSPVVSSEKGCTTLEDIKREWTALTFAVSQQKMSVGTNLQEGIPLKLVGNKLTVAFAPGNEFFKEFLDKKEHLKLIEDVFLNHMKRALVIDLTIAERSEKTSSPQGLNDALSIFQGKVVNEWHNGQ